MKRELLLVLCCIIYVCAIGQNNLDENVNSQDLFIPEKSEALQLLYEEAKYLENNGTVLQIKQNRLAIKNEWASISPEISDLYQPINVSLSEEEFLKYKPVKAKSSLPPIDQNRSWDEDLLIKEGAIHGIDMEVTLDGEIYLVAYENIIDNGGTNDAVSIFKSTNHGESFEEWITVEFSTPIRKMQVISLDGNGDEFLLVYLMFEGGAFIVVKFEIDTALFEFDLINVGLSDFAVDRNYPSNTNLMRVFASYLKNDGCETQVFSARSVSGSYGLEWQDEVDINNLCGDQIDFTYGKSGATYMTFLGATTNNLYAVANDSFNDPASWEPYETVEFGSSQENLNPTIIATKKDFSEDEVIIFLQARDAGETDGYAHKSYLRENSNAYGILFNGLPLNNQSAGPIDTWTRKVSGNEIIRTTYIRDFIDNTYSDQANSFTYNGTILTDNEQISDEGYRVWSEFPAVIAETNDGLPCVAFVGYFQNQAKDLYFDRESDLLEVPENSIESIQYYPNPTSSSVTIEAKETIQQLSLFTITGEKIKDFYPNEKTTTISLEHLAAGIYLVSVQTLNAKENFKIIKE